MEWTKQLTDSFASVETTKEHSGYWCSVGEALTIVILGSLCGLRNVNQIHQWASSEQVSRLLSKHFTIERVPCYYWLLCLLKIIKPTSLNKCFMKWTQQFLPNGTKGLTLSFDGKTIRSTAKMGRYDKPLHIISAHIGEMGVTIGQQSVDDKSNEIPAMRNLINLLNIEGCMIVADALHRQKETAQTVFEAGADYLLSVKDNQPTLKQDIAEYVQDKGLQATMDSFARSEKNSGRIEKRTAYATCDVDWIVDKENWVNIGCIGAINTRFTNKNGESNEWHYYISSRSLSAEELLRHARLEWSIETMHWLLDVHFGEDYCRIEDENTQLNLNIVRKIALNYIRSYKLNSNSKLPLSKIMFAALLDCNLIPTILCSTQN